MMALPQRKTSQKNQLNYTATGGEKIQKPSNCNSSPIHPSIPIFSSPHMNVFFFLFLFDCRRKTGHPWRMHADARRTCKSHPKKGQTKLHLFAQVFTKEPNHCLFYEPVKKNKDSATAGKSKQKLVKEYC